jgi:hypothetical protein
MADEGTGIDPPREEVSPRKVLQLAARHQRKIRKIFRAAKRSAIDSGLIEAALVEGHATMGVADEGTKPRTLRGSQLLGSQGRGGKETVKPPQVG